MEISELEVIAEEDRQLDRGYLRMGSAKGAAQDTLPQGQHRIGEAAGDGRHSGDPGARGTWSYQATGQQLHAVPQLGSKVL